MEEEKQPEAPKAATPKGHKSVAYYQLFKYSDGLDKLLVFLGVVGSVITGAALPFFSVLLSRVTNAFLFPNNSNLEHTVNQTALYFLLLGIGIMVASFTGIAAWTLAGTRITTRIKSLFLDAALRQDFNFYDTKGGPGQLLNDLTEEADAIMEATGPKAARFIQNVSTAVAGFIIAFVRGWEMTLVMLSLMPAFLVISAIAAQMTRKLKVQDNAAYARANTISVEALANVRTVHASNAEEVVLDSYHNSLSGPLAVGIKIGMIKGGIIGSYLFITYAAYALAIWYGSLKIADGTYNGGTVVNVLFAAILGAFSLAGALPLLQTFSRGQEAASRLYAVLDREPLISLEGGDTLDSVMGRIELKSVAFAYPSQPDILVFRDLNLVIEAGTNVALVGESGSGKSTIVGLVERFYDPLRGAVLLDGVDIKTLNLRWLRSKIGLVQQEPVLFAGSVSHNIMLGTAGATQEQAEDAARAANIHEFICSLPDGYDTMVGEKGTQLSGGQKQRLAIARALLKDPRILLLDEATSALDTKSERVVQKALDAVMQNRTSIIIAHRLSTVVRADAIAVLKDGVIVEQGKHTELMERGGIYSSLAKAQNLGDVFAEEEKGQESVLERFETMLSRAPERDVRVGVFLSEMSQGSMRTLGGFIAGAASVALRKKEKESEKKPPPEKNKNWSLMPSSSIPCCGAKKQTTAAAENGNVEPKVGGDAAEPLPQGSHFQRIAALNASEWKVAVLGVAAAAGMGAVQPVYAYVLSKSVNTLYNPDIAEMKSRVSMYSGIFVGIGGAALIFALGMFGAFSFMGHKLAVRVRLLLFRSMLRQEVAWFDKEENSTGVLVSRLAADSRAVKGQFGDSMGFLVQNATTIIVALSLAFATNWNLAIVVVAATPTVVITALVSMEYVSRAASAQTGFVAKADGRAAEALYNLRTVVTLGIEPDMSDSYNEKLKPALRAGGWHGAIDGGGYGIGQFFVYCMYSLAFWYGGKLVTSGNASPNDILQVFLPIFMAAFGAGQAQMYFPDVARGRAAATRVFSIVDRVPVIDNLDEGGDAPLECEGHLEFERVRFAYPSRPNLMVFKAFSLDIPPRTSMALVGESGSGKSTVVGLIQRFYAPLSGVVMLDGHDISTLNMRWLRSQVGLVGQEPVLFSMSVRDNITYGAGKVQDEQVQAAAAAAFAADFIDALPNGYDTLLGSGGVSLSGGQKQRLAIARALVKDPKIFLLDEATSALDVESEKLVTLALDKVMQGKTSIIVAHKLVTVERADCISVLQRGRIVEQGTHLELSQSNGIYAQLLRIQQGTKSQTRPPALEVESLQGEVPSHPVNSPSTPDSPP